VDQTRIPNNEDAAFPLIVVDALLVLLAVMLVQLKFSAEAALAEKTRVDANERQLSFKPSPLVTLGSPQLFLP